MVLKLFENNETTTTCANKMVKQLIETSLIWDQLR